MNLLCPRALHHQYRHSRAVRNRRQAPDAIRSGWGRLRSSRCGGCSPYGLLREMTQGHVFDHALAQRADGSSVMARTPVSREVLNPVISRQDEPSRYPPLRRPLVGTPTASAKRRYFHVALLIRRLSQAGRRTAWSPRPARRVAKILRLVPVPSHPDRQLSTRSGSSWVVRVRLVPTQSRTSAPSRRHRPKAQTGRLALWQAPVRSRSSGLFHGRFRRTRGGAFFGRSRLAA